MFGRRKKTNRGGYLLEPGEEILTVATDVMV
jgi:hypothetical protein